MHVYVCAVLAVFAFLVLFHERPAHADEAARDPAPDRARALALLERAEHDDGALEFRRALDAYDEALRTDPSMPKAMRAEERAKVLRAHAEGDFAPFAALERVRRSPERSSDPNAVDDLVRAAESFPPGLVRVEVWSFAAEAYDKRLHRPDDATQLWRRVADDPRAEPVIARAALGSLVRLHLARGDIAAAEADARSPLADPMLDSLVRRAARRRLLHLAAILTVAGTLLLAGAAVVRAARQSRLAAVVAQGRSMSRLIAAYAAYVAVAGGLLAAGYEDGNAAPFVELGAILALLLLLARAWSAAGSPGTGARIGRAIVCATSAFAAAFLVLEHLDASYLEGLGL